MAARKGRTYQVKGTPGTKGEGVTLTIEVGAKCRNGHQRTPATAVVNPKLRIGCRTCNAEASERAKATAKPKPKTMRKRTSKTTRKAA
jgi:hypothetical protein